MTDFSKPINISKILLEKEELAQENKKLKAKNDKLKKIIKEKEAVIDEYHEQQSCEMEYKE